MREPPAAVAAHSLEVHVGKTLWLPRVLVCVQPHFDDAAGLKQAGKRLVVRLPRHVACRQGAEGGWLGGGWEGGQGISCAGWYLSQW